MELECKPPGPWAYQGPVTGPNWAGPSPVVGSCVVVTDEFFFTVRGREIRDSEMCLFCGHPELDGVYSVRKLVPVLSE